MEAYEMPLTKLIKINLRRIPNENVLLKMYFREQQHHEANKSVNMKTECERHRQKYNAEGNPDLCN